MPYLIDLTEKTLSADDAQPLAVNLPGVLPQQRLRLQPPGLTSWPQF